MLPVNAPRARIVAVSAVLSLVALLAAVRVYQATETIPLQSPVVMLVEREMRSQIRHGRLRVLLDGRVLEVRVTGEALLGYTSSAPRLEDIDTNLVRAVAKKAIDLYAPPRFGPPPGVDSVRVRLRHPHTVGPIVYRVARRDFPFATAQLGR
jgi:hypothetical protein